MRVTHIITRLVVGGAQENTIATVLGLRAKPGVTVHLISGPTTGPEGSLESQLVAAAAPQRSPAAPERRLQAAAGALPEPERGCVTDQPQQLGQHCDWLSAQSRSGEWPQAGSGELFLSNI